MIRSGKHVLVGLTFCLMSCFSSAGAFEGLITATCTRDGQPESLLFTCATNALRIEVTGSDKPNPVDIFEFDSDFLTMVFPHNRTFVRLPRWTERSMVGRSAPFSASSAGVQSNMSSPVAPPGHGLPPGQPPGAGLQAVPGLPGPGGMPSMAMFMEVSELQPTGQKTNLLGFACEQYEIRQNGETMTLWATGELFPFRNYVVHQARQYGPRWIDDRWAGLLMARKLFPLRASLRTQDGLERFHFEVMTVKAQKRIAGDASLFLPPEGYLESRPLPF